MASNVFHTSPKLGETLSNVRKLPGLCGGLFLQELDPSTKWIRYVLGLSPGWWLDEEENRLVKPDVNSERWNKEFKNVAFERIDVSADGHLLNHTVARPAREEKSERITTFGRNQLSQSSEQILQQLHERFSELDFYTSDYIPRHGYNTIPVLDIETPFLYSAVEKDLSAFKSFISRI